MRPLLFALLVPCVASAADVSAFSASAGVGFLNRSFTWVGDPSAGFIPSSQPFAGAVAVDVTWFPGAHVTQGAGSWFGVFGQGEFGLGLAAKLANSDAVFAQSAHRLRTGAVARFPLGERVSLLVHAGYARQGFGTSTAAVVGAGQRPRTPDVLFDGPRGGLGARFRLGGTAELDVIAGAQLVTGFGELGTAAWFPNVSAFSTDAALGFSFGIWEHLRVRLSGQWQRTFLTLNGSAFNQQEAAEQYLSGQLTLQWAM